MSPPTVETHPGISLEPMYSEAVLAYNSKRHSEALKILDSILRIKPDYVQALELKALLLKSSGKPDESRKNYEALIRTAPKDKAAPYHFELGVIEYNAKKPEAAAPHFEASIRGQFNVDASHFFLGLIDFNLAAKPGMLGESEKHFRAVADGSTDELKPAAHYYLGLINYKKGFGSQGTHELIEARSVARGLKGNPLADDIEKAVNTALAPYGKGQWFGNLTILQAYNGNVSSLPNSITAQELVSGKGTLQNLFVAGFGRMSSPLNTIQWVGSYRGTFNLNYNSEASTYQFLTHTGSLYFTLNPLARTQYGIKLEGTFTFSYQNDLATDTSAFGKYSLTGEFGPYMRRELIRGLLLSVEAYYRPMKFYLQPEQTGTGYTGRITIQNDRGGTWLNPTGSVSYEYNNTAGPVFRSKGINLTASNRIRLGDRNTITPALMMVFYSYSDLSPSRSDTLTSIRLSWVHQLAPRWTLIADASYQVNNSTIADLYSYKQPVVSGGVGFNF